MKSITLLLSLLFTYSSFAKGPIEHLFPLKGVEAGQYEQKVSQFLHQKNHQSLTNFWHRYNKGKRPTFETLKIVTLNTALLDHAIVGPAYYWKRRQQLFQKLTQVKDQVDVILLQEVFETRDRYPLIEWAYNNGYFPVAGDFKGQNTGLLTLIKTSEIDLSRPYSFQLNIYAQQAWSEKWSNYQKGFISVVYTLKSGIRIEILNTHLTPFDDLITMQYRIDQAKYLSEYIQTNTNKADFFILGGDFNSHPEYSEGLDPQKLGMPYKIFIEEAGLMDTYSAVNDIKKNPGFTWNESENLTAKHGVLTYAFLEGHSPKLRFDYVFTKKTNSKSDFYVRKSKLTFTEVFDNSYCLSDHFGVLSEIRLFKF